MKKLRQKDYKKIGYYTFVYKRLGRRKSILDESFIYSTTSEISDISTKKLGEFAIFNADLLKDFENAEKYFKRALEKEPENSYWLGNYGIFLHYYKNDVEQAEIHYQKCLKYYKDDAFVVYNYAILLIFGKKDYDKAEKFLKKAIKLDYGQYKYLLTYIGFLFKIRKNFELAEKELKKLIKRIPKNPQVLAVYAQYCIFKDEMDKAEKLIDLAFELDPLDETLLELWFYRYAHFRKWIEKSEFEINKLLKSNVKCLAWGLQQNVVIALFKGHPNPKKLEIFSKDILGIFKI